MKERFFKKLNLQFFADEDGGSVSDAAALDDLLSRMDAGAGQDTGAQEEQQNTGAGDTQADGAAETDTQTQQSQATTQKPTQTERMNYAFGQLRTENAAIKGLLSKLATAAGIEYADEKDLITKLNDDALTKLAQRQNVPVDLLRRMETLEQNNAAYEAEQRKTEAVLGFQKLQNTYGLSNEELMAFAQELDEKGLNPFAQKIDIESNYRNLHFDEIVNKRVEAAVQEALKKSSVADTHSSTPNRNTGKSDGAGDSKKISTVSQLSEFLDGVK